MIIDLRDYTTTPGGRDMLIERCESTLFPEQERLGATLLGLFRDADDADRFVWLRGMPDMDTRKRVLTAFYTNGAMWKSQKAEVNSWIAESDDVLLVRPASEFAPSAEGDPVVGMYSCVGREQLATAAAERIRDEVEAAVVAAVGRLLITLVTDPAENNYPRHPIRTGESGLVWFATFPADVGVLPSLEGVAVRRLAPTATSRMR